MLSYRPAARSLRREPDATREASQATEPDRKGPDMKPNLKWGVSGVVLGLVAALTLPTIAQEDPAEPATQDRTVSTTGIAIVRSAPDEALVTLGVHTDADTAQEAMDRNAELMSGVITALLDAGLGEDQLATATLSLWPRWGDSGQDVVGFTAENQVTVTVRDLDRVGTIIDRAVGSGANLTSGITFRVSEANAAADEALTEALADALRKAEVLARAGGAELGEVVTITELSSGGISPPVVYAEAVAADGVATQVLPPTLESQVSVSVTWSLV